MDLRSKGSYKGEILKDIISATETADHLEKNVWYQFGMGGDRLMLTSWIKSWWVCLWNPHRYRMGRFNGHACIWYEKRYWEKHE